jgi:tetratricopeptide (TPR) repeat protein
MNKYFLCFMGMILILTACNVRSRQIKEMKRNAAEVDSILKITPVLAPEQRSKADELANTYVEFSEKYPDDTLSPNYLMRAAFIKHALPDYKGELKILETIAEKYPESDLAPQALATAAKISEDELQDLNRARKYYSEIQQKYPNSAYAVNIDLQVEYAGDAEGFLNAVWKRNNNNPDSIISADSVEAMK